ncbi:alpha/beta fold hydrolase [Catellatospora methionotrophica]|uniref:alpha/beta fold hydrolase n=1 Tax=Catellatospora methionotrophica TaxID=121620 RepID=UPI0034073750
MTFAATLTPGTHQLEIEGVRQVYHVAGTGPVCLVHSGGPGMGWEYLRMPALEAHLTMVYLEPVGTGSSGRLADRRDYRIDTYARFVHGVLDHLGADRAYLLGHSHGGFVVQRYALDHPDRVDGLILHSTSPITGPAFWNDAMANLQRLPERLPHRPQAAAIPAVFPQALAATDDETFTVLMRQVLPAYFADYWAQEAELAPAFAGFRAWIGPSGGVEPAPFDVRDELGSLRVPALIVSGKQDFICGSHWGTLLHEAMPTSRLLVLDCGHMAHLERPDAFGRAVVAFVGAQAGTAA